MAAKFNLPVAPADQTCPVEVWSQPVSIPTNHPLPPSRNPMFLGLHQRGKLSEISYYESLCLRRLGRAGEAAPLIRDLPTYSGRLLRSSLAAMLLFDDDRQTRRTVEARLLEAQAKLAAGGTAPARRLLQHVLSVDGSYALAADLLQERELYAH